ncbi:hypothetical protein ACFPN2_33515 [Steroidobacter flavus]|uniref:Uncharacterized protein n=1 Tax=Steroidobacter flavus TaxID=1842136 RepID=A0ABV8T3L8_9GAMM
MNIQLNRLIAAASGVAFCAIAIVGFGTASDRDFAKWRPIPPPAEDALTQAVDLNRIASFRYINDRELEVTDETGHKFNMKFTQDCAPLKDMKDFSLVTESFHDMDRFTGIGVNGQICTFKDFSPKS